MIEDAGTFGYVTIGIILAICIIVWIRNTAGLSEMQTGHLYMLYFFGDHSANEITNEMSDHYDARSVWNDLVYLEAKGLVSRDSPSQRWGMPRFDIRFSMTDEGEAAYKKHARRYGMDYVEDQKSDASAFVKGGPA